MPAGRALDGIGAFEPAQLRHQHCAVEILGGVHRAGHAGLDFVFTVCDSAANEGLPHLAGPADDRARDLPDPVAVEGDETQPALAFADTYRMLNNRIGIFTSLALRVAR